MNVTEPEIAVLTWRSNGLSIEEIAKKLGLSIDAVKRVFTKIAKEIQTPEDVVELQKMVQEYSSPKLNSNEIEFSIRFPDESKMVFILHKVCGDITTDLLKFYRKMSVKWFEEDRKK